MECRDLRIILALVGQYRSDLGSQQAIAERLGIDESTLRGYLAPRYHEHPRIPRHQEVAFLTFIAEVLGHRDLETARRLVTGSALAFHNALVPPGGSIWARLLVERPIAERLEVVLPPPASMTFGVSDDQKEPEPDAVVAFNAPFALVSRSTISGEGFVLAEHCNVWHFVTLSQDRRIGPVTRGEDWGIPGQRIDGTTAFMKEKTARGSYRYFAIGMAGRLTAPLRTLAAGVNPLSQSTLDAIAAELLGCEVKRVFVAAVSLLVE